MKKNNTMLKTYHLNVIMRKLTSKEKVYQKVFLMMKFLQLFKP